MTSVATSKEFLPDENGDYFAKFVRLDMYNSSAKAAWGEDAYIDIAYVGISGSLDAIYAINSDIVDENGRELPDPNAIPDPLPLYFDGEKISKAVFNGAGNKEVLEENGESFARIYGNGKAVEPVNTSAVILCGEGAANAIDHADLAENVQILAIGEEIFGRDLQAFSDLDDRRNGGLCDAVFDLAEHIARNGVTRQRRLGHALL
jgi:hypothetical protein